MNNGTIEQVGTPAEVYDRPASLYVAGFIGSPAMNFLPGRYNAARRGVVLEDGRCLPITDVHAVGDGQLVQLGIRPEHARLVPQGQGLFDARPDLIAGATVAVQFPPENAHLFDAVTDRRLGKSSLGERQVALSP